MKREERRECQSYQKERGRERGEREREKTEKGREEREISFLSRLHFSFFMATFSE